MTLVYGKCVDKHFAIFIFLCCCTVTLSWMYQAGDLKRIGLYSPTECDCYNPLIQVAEKNQDKDITSLSLSNLPFTHYLASVSIVPGGNLRGGTRKPYLLNLG
jgi:hypothetical protein